MFRIAAMLWMIVGTTIAGIFVMAVLAVPSLAGHAMNYTRSLSL